MVRVFFKGDFGRHEQEADNGSHAPVAAMI
jgi:hypothetical protein